MRTNPDTMKQIRDKLRDPPSESQIRQAMDQIPRGDMYAQTDNISVDKMIKEEHAEHGHWMDRRYGATQGHIVNETRPAEVKRILEQQKPFERTQRRLAVKPVTAGGKAFPIF